MPSLYDSWAPQKTIKFSIKGDLLRKAKELDINLPAALEHTLMQLLRQRQQAQWLTENRDTITAYNDGVERHGAFGDAHRRF